MLFALLALATTHPSPDALRCKTHGDRIDITLPASTDRRIGDLAVVRGRTWTVLVDGDHHFAPFRPGVRRLTLRPAAQMGAVDGRTSRAFPHAGTYRIVFADNLETEPETMITLDCLVRVR